MKFTLSWLKEYLDTNSTLAEVCETLTRVGLEVESLDDRAALAPFIIAEIKEAQQHPQADKLRVCNVSNGQEDLQIVCGAPNARAGIKVVMAPIGTIIPHNRMEIKASAIRGISSNGMLCSAAELELGEDSDGIMELPADAPVGGSFASYRGLNDPIIEVAITPNRGDCLGVRNIARDLAAAGLGQLKSIETKEIKGKGASAVSVTLNTPECPYFIGRTFKNLNNKPSPVWMQQRLQAIGIKPQSALVDITNYVSYAYNRPLHVYDVTKLQGGLQVRLSREAEKMVSLQHKEIVLPAGVMVIADDAAVQAVGGIIGAESSGCDSSTTEAFLEIAYFDPAHVATSGRKLGIHSDSRYRFERNVDPVFMLEAAELTTQLILECCGGEVSDLVIAGAMPTRDKTITFRTSKIETLGGVNVDAHTVERILTTLGFDIVNRAVTEWVLKVPSWRPDVEGEADIVEEILRIYGYHHVPETLLPGIAERTQAVLSLQQTRQWMFRRLLTGGRGFTEVVTWSFMSSVCAQRFHPLIEGLKLRNPISSDLDIMRQTIIPNLVELVARNHSRGFGHVVLFESGPVFIDASGKQQAVIAGLRSGCYQVQQPQQIARDVDCFDAKADLFALIESVNIPTDNVSVTREAPSWYHPGRSGAVKLGKTILGYFGELHPRILKEYDIPLNMVAFEWMMDALPAPKTKAVKTKPRCELSEFQKVERDFAFVMADSVPAETLMKAVRSAEKVLVTNVMIFDVYKGKGIESGQKSVAFSVTLTPKDKTLTDAEINQVSQQIIGNVSKQCNAVLRG